MKKIVVGWKVVRELGWKQAGQYGLYQLKLRSGWLRRQTPPAPWPLAAEPAGHPLAGLPAPEVLAAVIGPAGRERLLAEADEILSGQVRLFGGPPVALQLAPPGPLQYWTHSRPSPGEDIKWVWEPARFGWAFTLARAYRLTGAPRYAACFWSYFEQFQAANPPNQGPNWESAQEVALRLIALAFADQVFSGAEASTPERRQRLAGALATHARRIPPTLAYARAQNNNHLLSEAVGLMTAGLILNEPAWQALGWRWFLHGVSRQIAPDGEYVQHSASYHRLMLHLALWVAALQRQPSRAELAFPPEVQARLAAATQWLLALVEAGTGHVPNLGPHDGALILPLSGSEIGDYRPVLQAASLAFHDRPAFPPGEWDELALWLGLLPETPGRTDDVPAGQVPASPAVLRRPDHHAWAYLRAVQLRSRPGHADQLHLDLWWRGLNLAQDAGTFSYNASPPWENALAGGDVHNTVLVDGQDQMPRAGKFLFLDWAQAGPALREQAPDGSWERLTARHDGFRRLNVIHERQVTAFASGNWRVEDRLLPARAGRLAESHTACLHWLLPDWPWELSGETLRLESPYGPLSLRLQAGAGQITALQLVRAGEVLHGPAQVKATWGWASPTYGYKLPALALRGTVQGMLPFSLVTEFEIPPGS